MNPKDGKAGSPVSPAEAKDALDADTTDPGKMAELKSEQRQSKTGKYNPVKTQPHQSGSAADGKSGDSQAEEEKKSWIEIELIDDEKRPVPGAHYSVTLPDGTVADGTLDEKGFARIEGITAGNCKISFPDYDESCWKAASGGGSSGGGGKSGGGGGGGKSGGQSSSAGADGKSGGADQSFKSDGSDGSGGQNVKSGGDQGGAKSF